VPAFFHILGILSCQPKEGKGEAPKTQKRFQKSGNKRRFLEIMGVIGENQR
jgi:hypothetical protein